MTMRTQINYVIDIALNVIGTALALIAVAFLAAANFSLKFTSPR